MRATHNSTPRPNRAPRAAPRRISIPLVLCVLIFTGSSERVVNVFKSRWSSNVSANLLNRISRSAHGGNDGSARRVHLAKFRKLSARDRQRFSWAFAVVLRENLLMGIATGFVYFTVSDSQVLASVLLILAFLSAHIYIAPYKVSCPLAARRAGAH